MSGYTESELTELKQAVPIWKIAAERFKLQQSGKEYKANCPWHRDKTPSLTFYPAPDGTWLYECFGCKKKGNVFQFVMELDRCTFNESVEKVKKHLGWSAGAKKVQNVFQPMPAPEQKYEVYTLADLALAERTLAEAIPPQEFLLRRAISLETAKKHHLGFVQSAARVAPNHPLVDKGWILIPTIEGETVTCLKYRSIAEKAFVRKANMETGLYNTSAIDPFEDLWVVEGEFDSAAMTEAGYHSVALPGASFTLTPEMKDRLLQAGRIFLAGDSDAPGQAAMQKLWTELRDRTYLAKWPDSKDANEALMKVGGDKERFRAVVEGMKEKALEQPMPFVHDLTESFRNANDVSPMDNPARLRFPWPKIDKWCPVLPGDVMVVSASESGQGKTAWVMNILLENAIQYGKIVVNYSAEVSPQDYARRAAAYLTGIPKHSLGKDHYRLAAQKMKDARFYNGYKPGANYREVIELLRWAKRRLGADILVIDHIHFLTRSEKDEIKAQSEAMREIKDLAIEYGVIPIVVGQPRKPKDDHFGRELQMRGIKGSEALSSDASQVFILHRKRLSGDDEDTSVFSPETKVILDKGREAETSTTKLLFRGEICKFVEMAPAGMEE